MRFFGLWILGLALSVSPVDAREIAPKGPAVAAGEKTDTARGRRPASPVTDPTCPHCQRKVGRKKVVQKTKSETEKRKSEQAEQ